MTYSGKRINNNDVIKYTSNAGLFNGQSYGGSITGYSGCSFCDNMVERFDLTSADASFSTFRGCVFDGRYVYLIPSGALASSSLVTVRYDTTLPINETASYTSFNITTNFPSSYAFEMGTFDGRYVYYTPFFRADYQSGLVIRYDTTKSFASTASWSSFDILANSSTGNATYSFSGAQFDGRYIYFIPSKGTINTTATYTGVLWRYDTTQTFSTTAAWSSMDLQSISLNFNACQSIGNAFDGRYVYIGVRDYNLLSTTTELIRYDITKSFTDTGAYQYIDIKAVVGLSAVYSTFSSFGFDGTNLYVYNYGSQSSSSLTVLKYDVSRPFTSSASWQKLDLHAQNVNYRGYIGCQFDGRFIYFIPYENKLLLRYDTTKPFVQTASWTSFDIAATYTTYRGFYDGCFDGKYLYLAPYFDESGGSARGTFCRIKTRVH